MRTRRLTRPFLGGIWQSRAVRRFSRDPGAVIGLVIVLLLMLLAALAPLLAGDPLAQNLSDRLLPPSSAHLFGTDQLGRDVLDRVLWGSRISLAIGFLVVALSLVVGTAVGLLAGTLGGFWDNVLMRVTDIFLAFPALILAMAISAALGPSLTNVMIAVAAVSWPNYARLTQGAGFRNSGARVRGRGPFPRGLGRADRVAASLAQQPFSPLGASEFRCRRCHPDRCGSRLYRVWSATPDPGVGRDGL